MQISCLFGRDDFAIGGIVVVCLRQSNRGPPPDGVLQVQASGYITLDPKWVRGKDLNSGIFVQTPAEPLEQSIKMPQPSAPNTHCIFITPREVLPMAHVTGWGVYATFTLPVGLIPSFKGLSGSVSYSITLTLQLEGESLKHIRFPFTVLGVGSSTIPYEIKFASLAVFGASTVPTENKLLPQFVTTDEFEENSKKTSAPPINGVVYNIRDKGFICSLSMVTLGGILFPGSTVTITLHFDGSEQNCRTIRSHVQQCETRADGSRVQEKVITQAERSSIGAVLIYLKMHIPDNIPASFTSPLFNVSYNIVLEFFLEDTIELPIKKPVDRRPKSVIEAEALEFKNAGNTDRIFDMHNYNNGEESEPFTWTYPIEISPHRYPLCLSSEVTSCMDPVAEYIQRFTS